MDTGIVCVLRTFGRPLNWNPHIHMLVTEGAVLVRPRSFVPVIARF